MITSFRTIFQLVTAYTVRLIVSQVALAISALASIGFWMLILGPGGRGDASDSDCLVRVGCEVVDCPNGGS